MAVQTDACGAMAQDGVPDPVLDYGAGDAGRVPRLCGGDILAPAFAMTIGAWITAYILRTPLIQDQLDGRWTIGLMLTVVFFVGIFAGRYSKKGAWGAALAGCLSGLLDLLILGSLLHDESSGSIVPAAGIYILGSVLTNGLAAGLGGLIGACFPSQNRDDLRWTAVFAAILAAATLPLITAGGLVTAFHAGLAVPDWPRSYGYNMFLFPLSRMQEVKGNFLEHAHRLMGALVGFTILTVAVYYTVAEWPGWRNLFESRRSRRIWFAWSLFVAVGIQGALGGTRVTERSILLAMIHGVFAQIVFASMVLLAVVSTRRFDELPQKTAATARHDRTLTAVFLLALLAQIMLGALVRHINAMVLVHVSMAAIVALLALTAGFRAVTLQAEKPLRRAGLAVLILVGVQLLLGIIALALRPAPGDQPTALAALLTTAHQANGALLLAATATLTLWTWRLMLPAGEVVAEGMGRVWAEPA